MVVSAKAPYRLPRRARLIYREDLQNIGAFCYAFCYDRAIRLRVERVMVPKQNWLAPIVATFAALVAGCERAPDWDLIAPPNLVGDGEPTGQRLTEGEDLLKNGGFEEGAIESWIGLSAPGQSFDAQIKAEGQLSLRIDSPGQSGDVFIRQYLTRSTNGIRPLGRYRLRGQMKAEALPSAADIRVLAGKNMRSVYVGEMTENCISGTQDWTEFTIDFTVAAEASAICVAISCDRPVPPAQPSGTLWVDALSLRPLQPQDGR